MCVIRAKSTVNSRGSVSTYMSVSANGIRRGYGKPSLRSVKSTASIRTTVEKVGHLIAFYYSRKKLTLACVGKRRMHAKTSVRRGLFGILT